MICETQKYQCNSNVLLHQTNKDVRKEIPIPVQSNTDAPYLQLLPGEKEVPTSTRIENFVV